MLSFLRNYKFKNRHLNQSALILAPGPSLIKEKEKIISFIKNKENLVIFACNKIPDDFNADYSVYVNRKRFGLHGKNSRFSKSIIVSSFFSRSFIKNIIGNKKIEKVRFKSIYPGKNGQYKVDNTKILIEGGSVAIVSIALCDLMGFGSIFLAGLDGYSENEKTHYYNEADEHEMEKLLHQQKVHKEILSIVKNKFTKENRKISLITKSNYSDVINSI